MALLEPDLSIYGKQKPIQIKSPDEILKERAALDQAREAARQRREAVLDDARMREAMRRSVDPQSGMPDYQKFLGTLAQLGGSPATIEKAQTLIDTHTNKALTDQKTQLENEGATQAMAARWAGTIQSQADLDAARQMLSPAAAKLLPPLFDDEGKARINQIAQVTTTAAERTAQKHNALTDYIAAQTFAAGTPERLAKGLQATATYLANTAPEQYGQSLAALKGLNVDPAILQALPPEFDPERLKKLAIAPEKQAELAGQAESRANTAADNARQLAAQQETARHNLKMEGTAAARVAKMGQGGTAAGAPPRSTMPDEAINQAADRYFETGILPSLGMGNAAASDKRAIMARAGERHPGATIAYNTAAFAANKNTLTKLQNQSSAIAAFENTASKNLQQFEDLAAKIPDTGVPWLNTPVRALTQQMVGSANMAAVNAARQVALTEISRVVSNPNLTGALSDSAREEVLGLVPANATIRQIQRVANVLRTDMHNRHTSIDEQKADIEKRLGKDDGAAQKPAQKPANLIYDPATGTFKKGGG